MLTKGIIAMQMLDAFAEVRPDAISSFSRLRIRRDLELQDKESQETPALNSQVMHGGVSYSVSVHRCCPIRDSHLLLSNSLLF